MKGIDWTRRAELTENMDRADCPENRLFRTLDQFRISNPLLTRYRHLLTTEVIRPMQRNPRRRRHLIDLGAGGCDIARWLVRKCRKKGLHLKVTALERDPRILRYAEAANREFPEIELVQTDIMEFTDWGNADFVFANHLLHHLTDRACIELLNRLNLVAPGRYILSDIVRDRACASVFGLLSSPFRSGFFHEDGLISIRRGFTRDELVRIIKSAGCNPEPRVRILFPARFAIIGGSGIIIDSGFGT